MTTNEMIEKLITEKNYDRAQTERLAPKIDALPEDIRSALEAWVETGETNSPEYGGYTAAEILKAQPQFTVLGAYLTLDWMRRDPKTAAAALKRPFMRRG